MYWTPRSVWGVDIRNSSLPPNINPFAGPLPPTPNIQTPHTPSYNSYESIKNKRGRGGGVISGGSETRNLLSPHAFSCHCCLLRCFGWWFFLSESKKRKLACECAHLCHIRIRNYVAQSKESKRNKQKLSASARLRAMTCCLGFGHCTPPPPPKP